MAKAKLTPRKKLTIVSLLCLALFVGLSFLPLYPVRIYGTDGSTVEKVWNGGFIEAMWCVNDPKNAVRVGVYCFDAALVLLGLVYLILSLGRPLNDITDKEDKYYVYGMFFFIAGTALKGMGDFGFGYTIIVFITLFFAFLGIGFVVLHHKKISET